MTFSKPYLPPLSPFTSAIQLSPPSQLLQMNLKKNEHNILFTNHADFTIKFQKYKYS